MSNQPGLASWRHLNRWQFWMLPSLATWLGFMTLNRFLLYRTGLRWFDDASMSELVQVFITGLRFDLLVLGFVLLPVIPLSWLVRRGDRLGDASFSLIRGFLGFSWAVIVLLGLVGHVFFVLKGRQMSWWDLSAGFVPWPLVREFLMGTSGVLVLLISLCQLSIGWRELGKGFSRIRKDRNEELETSLGIAWWKNALRALGPWLLVGLAARGTVTPHHLEKQHSDVSSNPSLNQLVLNPVWSFDKKPDAP